jgi:hypothetical protein
MLPISDTVQRRFSLFGLFVRRDRWRASDPGYRVEGRG